MAARTTFFDEPSKNNTGIRVIHPQVDANATIVMLLGEADCDDVEVRVDDDGGYALDFDAPPNLGARWSAEVSGTIARAIVEDHGGHLRQVMHPGRGCTAHMRLPRTNNGAES